MVYSFELQSVIIRARFDLNPWIKFLPSSCIGLKIQAAKPKWVISEKKLYLGASSTSVLKDFSVLFVWYNSPTAGWSYFIIQAVLCPFIAFLEGLDLIFVHICKIMRD